MLKQLWWTAGGFLSGHTVMALYRGYGTAPMDVPAAIGMIWFWAVCIYYEVYVRE